MSKAVDVIGAGAGLKGIALGGPIGKYAPGSLTAPYYGGDNQPGQPVNEVDPRLKAIRDQQIKDATDYKNNLDSTRSDQYQIAEDTGRQQLASDLSSARSGANARGMLYGSYEQGKESDAVASNASALAAAKANINTGTQNTLNQLQNQALGSGMTTNQMEQNYYNQAYQEKLFQAQQKANAFGSLFGGGGSGLGLLGSGAGRVG